MAVSMPTQNTWYTIATGSEYTTTLSGYTAKWKPTISARWTALSGTTYTVQYKCSIVKVSGGLNSATSSTNAYKIAGSGASTASGGSGSTFTLPSDVKTISGTFNASGGTSISVSGGVKIQGTGDINLSGTGTLPSVATPPTAPTISASTYSSVQINVAWGTTNLGTPSGTVYLYNGTSSNPTTQISSKTTTGSSTYSHTGRTANTRYYYKATATNSAGSASSSVVNAVTSPAGITSITGGSLTASSIVLTLVFASSGSALTTTAQISPNNSSWSDTSMTNVQGTTKTYSVTGLAANTSYTRYFRVHTSVGNSGVKSFTWATKPANTTSATATNIGETTATIAVACGASGSAATTDLQISSDNVNWTTVASNVQGTTVNVSVTGLTPNTSTTRYFRVHTVYGNSDTRTITFTTLKVAHLYGSVNDASKRVRKLYGSVNGQTKAVKKLYASVNGVTKLIYRE